MVGPLVMPKNPYHVRSVSMPPISHPLALRVDDQLQKLQAWETSSSSAHLTVEMLCDGFLGLGDLNDSIQDLLQSPLTQQALVRNGSNTWVNEMLDGSLRILDLCETTKDVFKLTRKMCRTSYLLFAEEEWGNSGLHNHVIDYISSRKKMKKEMDKCLKELKTMESKFAFSTLYDEDQHLVVMIGVLRQVRSITISSFESLSSFISLSTLMTKTTRPSLISKWMAGKGRVACEVEKEKMSEAEQLDAYLCNLCVNKSCKDIDTECVKNVHKGLKAMDVSLQSLENELNCVFRGLIKTRVSVLNILNY